MKHPTYQFIQMMRWVKIYSSNELLLNQLQMSAINYKKLSALSFFNVRMAALIRLTWRFSCSLVILTRQSSIPAKVSIFSKMIVTVERPTPTGAGFRVTLTWRCFVWIVYGTVFTLTISQLPLRILNPVQKALLVARIAGYAWLAENTCCNFWLPENTCCNLNCNTTVK